jgi:hypothetical protein
VLPIAYGFLPGDHPAIAAADRGEVILGGCVVPPDPIPWYRCASCHEPVDVEELPASPG